ncbi:Rpn family recombination-promoting nuclease/putative transposase, partial [Klebsiella pneumoniae]
DLTAPTSFFFLFFSGVQMGLERSGLEMCGVRKKKRGCLTVNVEKGPKLAGPMLQNGIDRNTVMKMTGLTEDDLAQIRH